MEERGASKRARDFFATRKALILATMNAEGRPTASIAPFVRQNNFLYVYTSGLSQHTKDFQETGKTSALVVEDEAGCVNPFARKRITFSCSVVSIPRESEEWRKIMGLFEEVFKNVFFKKTSIRVFALIRPLVDFTLFRLLPHEAIYVEDFGKAFQMTADLRNPVHLRGTGPGASPLKRPERTPPFDVSRRKI